MQCDICFRTGGDKLPFLCPVDARNRLYEPRIKHAQTLLEKEVLDGQISAITSGSVAAPKAPERLRLDEQAASRDMSLQKTEQIIAQAEELRKNVEAAKIEVEKRKAIIARRKSEMGSAKNGLEPRRARLLDEADKKIKMTTYKWNQMHVTTAQSRAYLCVEAAKLYGLQRVRDSNGGFSNEYSISGVPILDLRAMCNKARPAEITSSLTQIAHLLVLSSHYLSLRLPAEITLPHRDYPLPTIFPLKDSHKSINVPFPGSTPIHSSSNSPSASRHEESVKFPRPRPLFINKPLPALSKEDLFLFLEGATLLAYNIAWVCKTQGVTIGSSNGTPTVDDICEIGPNLFRVLIGSGPRPSPPSRASSTRSTPSKSGKTFEAAPSEDGRLTLQPGASMVGQFSHGTAHTFLGGTQGNEFQRGFKLPSPSRISEQLKTHVQSEVAGTGWTLVGEDAAFEDEADMDDGDGVIVGGRKDDETSRREGSRRAQRAIMANTKGLSDFGAASFMTMQTVVVEEEKKPGTKGWTLLKDRS